MMKKKQMKLALVLLVFAGIFSRSAHADILFVDMNENTQEVAAAQAAAQARGEKLVVIPDFPPAVRTQADKIKAQIQVIEDKITADENKMVALSGQIQNHPNMTPQQNTSYQNQLTAISNDVNGLYQQETPYSQQLQNLLNVDAYHVTPATIDKVLSQYDKEGKQFDSFILSSHHVANFYSDYGSVFEESDLTALLAAHPKQQAGIASVYFWGCYNGAAPTMLAWKGTFPKANVIVGWDGLAPEEHRAIDESLLKDLLEKEKSVSQIADAKTMLATYKAIPGIQESSGAFANFCGQGLWVGPGGVQSFANVKCDPAYLAQVRATVTANYSNYMFARTSATATDDYSDVPANRDNSALRTAYTQLRETEDCPGMSDLKAEVPKMLNLIYFKTIEKNFQVYFGPELAEANQILAQVGISIPDLSDPKVTRAQVLQTMQAVFGAIEQTKPLNPPNARFFLSALYYQMDDDLEMLSGMDSSWLTPATSKSYLRAPQESDALTQAMALVSVAPAAPSSSAAPSN